MKSPLRPVKHWRTIIILMLLIGLSSGCSNPDPASNANADVSQAITFGLNFETNTPRDSQALAEPDVCADYRIEDIEVGLYRTADNHVVATALRSCSIHGLTIDDLPVGVDLYLVCRGLRNQEVQWHGRMDGITLSPGESRDVGAVAMTYAGDDNTPPEVVATLPGDGETNIDLNRSISVVFNEPLAPSSISDQAIVVTGNGTTVPGVVDYDAETYTVRFTHQGLAASTTYTFSLIATDTDHPTDAAGLALIGDFNWQFTTGNAANPDIVLMDSSRNALTRGGTDHMGTVNVYATAEAVFTIRNEGTVDLSVSDILLTSGHLENFSIDTTGMLTDIAPGGETQFRAAFHSTTGGLKTAALQITGNDDPFDLHLSANAFDYFGILRLDEPNDLGMYTSIAVDENRIFISYYDETDRHQKVARSLNDGIDWSRYTITSGTSDVGRGASIAVDGNRIYSSTTLDGEIGLTLSDDGGDTWSTGTILTDPIMSSNGDYSEFNTSVAIDAQNIYIAFLGSNHLNMVLAKSPLTLDDWMAAWVRPPQGVEIEDESGYYASTAVNSGSLYVSHSGYTQSDIFFTRVPDTLADPVSSVIGQVNETYSGRSYTALCIKEINSRTRVYVAYFDSSAANQNLKLSRSANNGDTFSDGIIIDESNAIVGKYPSMAISDAGTIYISYYDESNQNLKLAIINEDQDYNLSWETLTVDDSTDNVGLFTSVAAKGQKVYISYYDASNKDLKFAKSIDGGHTWQ